MWKNTSAVVHRISFSSHITSYKVIFKYLFIYRRTSTIKEYIKATMTCCSEKKIRFVKVVKRFVPLIFALRMGGNICVNIYLTIIYDEHAFGNWTYNRTCNGTTLHENVTVASHCEPVTNIYLICACVVWMLPPVLFSIRMLLSGTKHPLATLALLMGKEDNNSWTATNLLLTITLFPFDILSSFAVCHVVLPIVAIVFGWKEAINHKSNKDYGDFLKRFLPQLHPFICMVCAAPQLILGIIFIFNNAAFLMENTSIFGFPYIVVFVWSFVLSSVSLLRGVYVGCHECCERLRDRYCAEITV